MFTQQQLRKCVEVTLAISGYLTVGPGLILLNRHIQVELGFKHPITLSSMGVLTSVLVAYVVVATGYVSVSHPEKVSGIHWWRRVLPVGIAHAATLTFGNAVYLLLGVGFIQMCKAFTPVIVSGMLYLARVETPSRRVMISLIYICVGTAVTTTFEPHATVMGLGCMFMAEIMEATRLALTQFLLQNLKFSVIEGQYILAPATALSLIVASLVLEGRAMIKNNSLAIVLSHPLQFFFAATLGLAVNLLSMAVVKVTNSVTLKVLGTARGVGLVLYGIVFFGEQVTSQEALGYVLTLVGFAMYTQAQTTQPKLPPPPLAATNTVELAEKPMAKPNSPAGRP